MNLVLHKIPLMVRQAGTWDLGHFAAVLALSKISSGATQ